MRHPATNAEGGVTSYSYNAAGQITSLTDPESNATTWTYNGLGLVASETNALSKTRSFTYDVGGNLVSRTDRRGLVREFSYDGLGRPTAETWKNGGTTVRTIDYAYDANSQLVIANDPDSGYDFTYDHLGRIINVDNDATPNVPRVQLESAYDAASRRTSVTATIGTTDDFVNEYTYDNLDRLTRLDQIGQGGGNSVAEKRVDFAYNALGQFTSIVRYKDTSGGSGNEVATSAFTYDSLARLTALDHTHGATNLANYDWSYDTLSRVTQFVSSNDGTSDYSYDDTSQIVDADHDYQGDESYTWDDNGNRVDTGYTVGANNRTTSDGTFNYTYDDEGNRLTKVRISSATADDKTVEYTWDHRNRLTQVTFKNNAGTVTQAVQYVYDVFDRKIARLRDVTSSFDFADAAIERYVYDGDDVVLEFSDPDGNGSSPLELSKRYLFGPAVDQILAQEDVTKSVNADDRVLWPLTDNLGTVRDLADQTGAIDEHYAYDSAGRLTAIEDGSGNPLSSSSTRYHFTGREYDDATDLQYNRARWYDAALLQWLSEDPIGFAAGDANLRRYVGNSYTNATDPSGLEQSGPTNTDVVVGVVKESFLEGVGWAFWPYGLWRWKKRFDGHIQDARTVWENMGGTGASSLERGYVAGGTVIATAVGIRQASDAASEHDAVDGHRQPVAERILDGVDAASRGLAATYGVSAAVSSAGRALRGARAPRPAPAAAPEPARTPEIIDRPTGQPKLPGEASSAPAAPPAITPPTSRGGLRAAMGEPPAGLANPNAHHDLPWSFRHWFAAEGRGLNVNDPACGRWVSGTPPGGHQRWSAAFEAEWAQFIRDNPNATRQQVLDRMNELRCDPRFR